MEDEEKKELKLKKGDTVFVMSGWNVIKGIFISCDKTYNYIENESGAVLGYVSKVVCISEVEALREIVEQIKNGIYYQVKKIVETISLPDNQKLVELIEVIEKVGKKLPK